MAISPASLIFLDIDGVLIDRFNEKVAFEIALQERVLEETGLHEGYSKDLVYKRAAARCFSPVAMAYLKDLIGRVSQAAIVISSSWRKDGDLDTLKNYVFADVFFRDLILDKTPDGHCYDEAPLFSKHHFEPIKSISDLSQEKYGFTLNNDKGREIDFWLRENGEKMKIKSFVILDHDADSEIRARFPKQFLQVGYTLLSQEDADEACEILSATTFSSDCFRSEESVRKALEEQKKYRQEECAIS
jgi:hypothetical protein